MLVLEFEILQEELEGAVCRVAPAEAADAEALQAEIPKILKGPPPARTRGEDQHRRVAPHRRRIPREVPL
jgi:hypothetical protein